MGPYALQDPELGPRDWATKDDLKKAVVMYPAYPESRVKPRHLADVFTATKMYTTSSTGRGAPFIWVPHSDAKVRFSAYEMLVFAVHSIDVLRPFVPADLLSPPDWWMAWKTHCQVFLAPSNPIPYITYTSHKHTHTHTHTVVIQLDEV